MVSGFVTKRREPRPKAAVYTVQWFILPNWSPPRYCSGTNDEGMCLITAKKINSSSMCGGMRIENQGTGRRTSAITLLMICVCVCVKETLLLKLCVQHGICVCVSVQSLKLYSDLLPEHIAVFRRAPLRWLYEGGWYVTGSFIRLCVLLWWERHLNGAVGL